MFVSKSIPLATATLQWHVANMSDRTAAQRFAAIASSKYPEQQYASIGHFVKDVAALAKSFPEDMRRKNGFAMKSLQHATRPVSLEYLMNGSRFAARHPDVVMPYGTTKNEATHAQLKAFWRNVFHQTSRHASIISAVATLAKLLASFMSETKSISRVQECTRLRQIAQMLLQQPLNFLPVVNRRAVIPQVPALAALPPGVKVPRKRPAALGAGGVQRRRRL